MDLWYMCVSMSVCAYARVRVRVLMRVRMRMSACVLCAVCYRRMDDRVGS